MFRRLRLLAFALCLGPPISAYAENPAVRIATPLGNIDLELCQEVSALCLRAAPDTVANFLSYVDDGSYDESFVHRSVPGFVIQGGSFRVDGDLTVPIATRDPVMGESSGFSNLRGTVTVPLLSDPPGSTDPCAIDPDSGRSGWFINLKDNSFLDCAGFEQGFTVFAVVTEGLEVADSINALFRLNFGLGPSPVTDDYECNPNPPGSTNCTNGEYLPHLVYTDVTRVPEPDATLGALAASTTLAWSRRRGAPRRNTRRNATSCEEEAWAATA